MNVALRPSPAASPAGGEPAAALPRIARVEIIRDLAAAEPHWRALEYGNALMTAYQRYEFLALWQQHVGTRESFQPFIVVAFDHSGAPLCLLPFGCKAHGPFRVAEFLGGKHANFNLALWRRDAARALPYETVERMLAAAAAEADALVLTNQPLLWDGLANPFALLPHQPSADSGYSGALMPDFDALLEVRASAETRRKMNRKERMLAKMGVVSFERATAPDDIAMLLATFSRQKDARLRAAGIKNVFTEPGVPEFLSAISLARRPDGTPLVELFALKVGDSVAAMWSGIVADGRFSAMFNSMIDGKIASHSPGEQLLSRVVRHCCERGLTTFDLGAGSASYKGLFCPDEEPLFDSFLPLTPRGHIYVTIARAHSALKRTIKQNPKLWAMVGALRHLRARFR